MIPHGLTRLELDAFKGAGKRQAEIAYKAESRVWEKAFLF
jgi:hypothetical protein